MLDVSFGVDNPVLELWISRISSRPSLAGLHSDIVVQESILTNVGTYKWHGLLCPFDILVQLSIEGFVDLHRLPPLIHKFSWSYRSSSIYHDLCLLPQLIRKSFYRSLSIFFFSRHIHRILFYLGFCLAIPYPSMTPEGITIWVQIMSSTLTKDAVSCPLQWFCLFFHL